MHTGGAAHLRHAADRLLHFLRRHQHQIRQLIDHDHDGRQMGKRFIAHGKRIVAGKVLHAMLGEDLIALHHLVHCPLQRAGRLLRVGDNGDEQVRNAVVRRKLDHLRIDHDKAHVLRRGLVKKRHDQRVRANRLAGARRAGDEHVRQLGNITDDVLAADVFADGKRDIGFVRNEFAGFEHVADMNGRDELVRHLDPDDRDLVGDRRDAHAACAERKGDIVLQIGDLGELDSLVKRKFIACDGRTAHNVARLCLHAEACKRFGKAS